MLCVLLNDDLGSKRERSKRISPPPCDRGDDRFLEDDNIAECSATAKSSGTERSDDDRKLCIAGSLKTPSTDVLSREEVNNRGMRRSICPGRGSPSLLLTLVAINNNDDNDEGDVDGSLIGMLPSKSVHPAASTTHPHATDDDNRFGGATTTANTQSRSSDDEEINAWIWKPSSTAKTSIVTTTVDFGLNNPNQGHK
jgi:hypothetical protein